ncbi:MAG: hypothetical protein K2Y28_06030 [Burkholderiaceae bacterium]|nr:hypothetical protein [Burkholderiaceae bacterium]
MPELIRTPEQIFREEEKDIYFIRFFEEARLENPKAAGRSRASKEMLAWLRTALPHVRVEKMAPSENSGWISGYLGDIRVDFSEASLAIFCQRWENSQGESNDSRLRCFLMPYDTWAQEQAKFVPTIERPTSIGATLWWDTPIGFVYHQVDDDPTTSSAIHPGNRGAIWKHALRLWPELAAVKIVDIAEGEILKREGIWDSTYFLTRGDWPLSRVEALRTWFHMPDGGRVFNDF